MGQPAGDEDERRLVDQVVLAADAERELGIERVGIVRVRSEKADDLVVFVDVLLEDGVAVGNMVVPRGVHLERARNHVAVHPQNAPREALVHLLELRRARVRVVQLLDEVLAVLALGPPYCCHSVSFPHSVGDAPIICRPSRRSHVPACTGTVAVPHISLMRGAWRTGTVAVPRISRFSHGNRGSATHLMHAERMRCGSCGTAALFAHAGAQRSMRISIMRKRVYTTALKGGNPLWSLAFMLRRNPDLT